MSFKILLLAPDADPSWPEKIRRSVPGIVVNTYSDPQDALDDIADADAAYGTVPPELLARARKLRWICAARAGLGGAWFYDALVNSDVLVTNMRGSYNEHLAAHAVAFLLAFARRFDHYLPQKRWRRGQQALRRARHAGARHRPAGDRTAARDERPGNPRAAGGAIGRSRFRDPDDTRDAGHRRHVQCATVRADEARCAFYQYCPRPLRRDRRSRCGSPQRPPRRRRPRRRGPRAIAARSPAVEHAERADHPACCDLRHPLPRQMGGDADRKLPPLCRRATVAQYRRQGEMVLMRLIHLPSNFVIARRPG